MSKESNVRTKSRRVLLTGATGFVGRHLETALAETNWEVRRATRDRRRAAEPGWAYLDVEDASSIEPALEGCDAAIYLIHSTEDSKYADCRFDLRRAAGLAKLATISTACPTPAADRMKLGAH